MRIAIIGFGFSGLMAAVNLIRAGEDGLTLYLIDEAADGCGMAYSTTNPEHLLNVAAGNMSAFADAPEHLVQWLATADAAAAKAQWKLTKDYMARDFVPRALYGAYLASIWREAQELAAQKNLSIKWVATRAVAITKGEQIAVLTERGDAIAVDKVILAVGHEHKAILPQVKSAAIMQDIWAADALKDAKNWASPVMLMGTGLTAVDMVLSLRLAQYAGEIIIASRRGLMPRVHARHTSIFSFTDVEIAAHKTLRQMLRMVRTKIAEHGDWRAVFDALRPHTQSMWQRLATREQQQFLSRLMPLWGVHRHRMAPEIADTMENEISAKKTRIIASKKMEVMLQDGTLQVTTATETFTPSHILNCTGLELNIAKSGNALLKQLLADGMVEAHVTGLGIAADKNHRAWGALYPDLYVIGSLLTGQLLESTAVPELRNEAASVKTANA